MMTEHPRRVQLAACAAVAIAAIGLLPWVGAERVAFSDVLSVLHGEPTVGGTIFLRLRLPRVLLAAAIGGALSVAGATLQVLFRNPLAEPWTLGVSGGAAVGAFAAHVAPRLHGNLGPLGAQQGCALAGAAAAMALVWGLSRQRGVVTTHTLLLAGVTLSVISGGLIMLAIYFISPFQFASFHRWTMGGLDIVGYGQLWSVLLVGGPGLVLLYAMAREYNHIACSEDMAAGHGVDVPRVHRLTFLGAGLTTAACVAVAGPIGFVGMIVPHIARRLTGFDHRQVIPAAFLLGATALAVCDGIARTVLAPTEIPVGIITAVIGGPIFLYLLGRH